ncbi:hypothetical protein KNT89_gp50 [Gordonia phage Petra]|uniref:Uncharacterized protein n=2 Tax=root TaxID=1 RepID=A0A2U8UKL6_9CAUD|nr:hypothetical protein [Gordonia westfalica]YP_010095444.1 hypothetical protein KNT89_gp50 [Gordonia phage Petra]AWN04163.1 hypothetical protein PBI_PETRA_50 [Gordonia phage Petra]SDU65153.1 hypothetical protein SAMN04488548_1342985 [Gordonia westfalica]
MNTTAADQPTAERSQFAERDNFRDLTPYEEAILHGMTKPAYFPGRGYFMVQGVYQGYADDRVITHRDGTVEAIPDPRIARTERRRARNKAGRKSRRINRIRARR